MTPWCATSAVFRLWRRAQTWCFRQQLLQGLGRLFETDTDQILHDVRLSICDMQALTHHGCGPQVLLPQRIEMAGLDPARLWRETPTVMRDLELTCARCNRWRRCARDLAQGACRNDVKDYCDNAGVIDTLAGGETFRH